MIGRKIILFAAIALGLTLALVAADGLVDKPDDGAAVPAGAATERSPDCAIKGNIGRTRARLYHMPGDQYYASIKIDTAKGERWFCSEEQARDAGWRPSKR